MEIRLDYSKAAPGSVQAMYKLQKYVDDSGLEHPLLDKKFGNLFILHEFVEA